MNAEQRKPAREVFGHGEPGFGISACENMASGDIALMCDTSANDAQPSGEKGPTSPFPATPRCRLAAASGIWRTWT